MTVAWLPFLLLQDNLSFFLFFLKVIESSVVKLIKQAVTLQPVPAFSGIITAREFAPAPSLLGLGSVNGGGSFTNEFPFTLCTSDLLVRTSCKRKSHNDSFGGTEGEKTAR